MVVVVVVVVTVVLVVASCCYRCCRCRRRFCCCSCWCYCLHRSHGRIRSRNHCWLCHSGSTPRSTVVADGGRDGASCHCGGRGGRACDGRDRATPLTGPSKGQGCHQRRTGVGRHWPDARGVFTNESRSCWAWINEEDTTAVLYVFRTHLIDNCFTLFQADLRVFQMNDCIIMFARRLPGVSRLLYSQRSQAEPH